MSDEIYTQENRSARITTTPGKDKLFLRGVPFVIRLHQVNLSAVR
jgi:hypothetical protein